MSAHFALIGHPVGHSISPAIHQAAYEILGVDASYSLIDCPTEEAVKEQVARVRSGEVQGLNVTVPWKHLAFELADEQAATARGVGVANVLSRTASGRLIAHNTDASALGTEIARACGASGVRIDDRSRALVIGAGGAALAAVVACRLAGFGDIAVTARRFVSSVPTSAWPRAEQVAALGARLLQWPLKAPGLEGDETVNFLRDACLIVQATSAGMKGTSGGDELAVGFPLEAMPRGVAYDLVYTPAVTPFLRRATEVGHTAVGGLGMLVGQAADAIRIWTGNTPAHEPLLDAARRALSL